MANKKSKSSKANTVALAQPKKVEKRSKKKLPTTIALVYGALIELDNKKSSGSSFKAIRKYIATKYEIETKNLIPTCKQIMKQEINLGNIIQVGRKFLLTHQRKWVAKSTPRYKNDWKVAENKNEEWTPVKKGKKMCKGK